jgi:hypothetical protein
MGKMKMLGTCIALTLIGLHPGFAQDEFDPLGELAEKELPKMIRVQVEFIEVPQEMMTALLSAPRKSANDTELRAELQKQLEAGKAKMLETQMVTARSGQKATSESIHEFIYPTEYSPPELPSPSTPLSPIRIPAIPTAFETRNLGSTLEIEPTLDVSGSLIDLRLLPELTYHTGNNTWQEVTEGKDTYRVQMPNFYKISFNTSMALIPGQPFLASAASPKDDKGDADFTKKVLIFVQVDVLTVGR